MKGISIFDKFLKNTIYFKILWAILVLLKINPIVSRKTSLLFYLIIVYGAIIILYDFFTEKKMFKNKYINLIILFLLFMGISSIINYDKGLIENTKLLIVTILQFMVIGRNDKCKPKEDIMRDMRIINNIIISMVSMASLISLYLFIFGINGSYEVASESMVSGFKEYYYGVAYGNRLVGIFPNPNLVGPYCLIAVICAMNNLTVFGNKWACKLWYYFSIVINFICVILSDSRGTFLPLYVCVFVLVFLRLLYFYRDNKNKVLKYFKIILLSSISVIMMYMSVHIIDEYMRVIPKFFNEKNEEIILDSKRQDLVGNMSFFKKSSGRINIWKAGIVTAKKRPLFGVGKAGVYESMAKNWDEGHVPSGLRAGGLHNIFLETLVAYGFLTLAVLVLLISKILIEYYEKLKNIMHADAQLFLFAISILIMLLFIIFNNLFESIMLYRTNLPNFTFILYLGYAMYITQSRMPRSDVLESN